MKYIITESQYNKIIDRFISSQFEGFEAKTTSELPNSIFWIKYNEVILEIRSFGDIWVDKDIWDMISTMFSLDTDGVDSALMNWMKVHQILKESSVDPEIFRASSSYYEMRWEWAIKYIMNES